ncbi:MAG: AraC family transcriptional regulator [Pseudomonadota bacterium]
MPLKTLNTLLRVVLEQGYPLDQALSQIGLDFNPLDTSTRSSAEISTACYSKLYRLLMDILEDEAFGLGQAYHAPPGTFRMMCLFIIHCQTLEQALVRSWEFHDYCDRFRGATQGSRDGPLQAIAGTERVLCLFERNSAHGLAASVAHANVLLMMYRFYSWLIARPLPLLEVHLRVPRPSHPAHYQELFGCPVRFDEAHTGLVISQSVLQYPVAQNEDSLRDFLRQLPYPLVKRSKPGQVNSLSQRIEGMLTSYASQRLPNAELMARQLNMSPRTLHRKLTAEGTSLQQIKDDFRRDLAIHYMGRPELTIDAIATLMGFQDSSAFYRSFKKWTGKSPGSWRRAQQDD